MKKIVVLLLLTFGFSYYCQAQVIDRKRMYPDTRSQSGPMFNPYVIAGLIKYEEIEKAAKKSKIRKKDLKAAFLKRLKEYNKSINGLSRINGFVLDDLKKNYDAKYKAAMASKNFKELMDFQKEMVPVMKPIKRQAFILDSVLNHDLKSMLSKKQYSKWINYSNDIKLDAYPKRKREPTKTLYPTRRRGF